MPLRTQLPNALEYTGDRATQAIQAVQRKTADQVNSLGGPRLKTDSIAFTAGETKSINHRLGRQPVAWIPVDVTIGYSSFRRTAWNDKTISIQAENACTAVFEVW